MHVVIVAANAKLLHDLLAAHCRVLAFGVRADVNSLLIDQAIVITSTKDIWNGRNLASCDQSCVQSCKNFSSLLGDVLRREA